MQRRRPPRRGPGFILGALAGVAAGLGGGLILLKRTHEGGTDGRAPVAPLAASAAAAEGVTATAGEAVQAADHVRAAAVDRGRDAVGGLQQRWRAAIAAGRAEADRRRRELERQLQQMRETTNVAGTPAPPAQPEERR